MKFLVNLGTLLFTIFATYVFRFVVDIPHAHENAAVPAFWNFSFEILIIAFGIAYGFSRDPRGLFLVLALAALVNLSLVLIYPIFFAEWFFIQIALPDFLAFTVFMYVAGKKGS